GRGRGGEEDALSGVFNARNPHRTIRTSKGAVSTRRYWIPMQAPCLHRYCKTLRRPPGNRGLPLARRKHLGSAHRVVSSGHGLRSSCSRVIITCRIVLEEMPRCFIFVANSSRDSPKGNCGRAAGCDSVGDERFAIAVTTSSRRSRIADSVRPERSSAPPWINHLR